MPPGGTSSACKWICFCKKGGPGNLVIFENLEMFSEELEMGVERFERSLATEKRNEKLKTIVLPILWLSG